MALTLALLEGISLFAVSCSMIVFWSHTVLSTWTDVAILILKGFGFSSCCIVSFYYNDLYDLRTVRSFSAFASRLLQSFGVAFILLAGFYTIFPKANIAEGPFASSLLIIVALLLPIRAVSYAAMRSRPFVERLLILGVGPLSNKLIAEIEAQPHFRYTIVGLADDTRFAGGPSSRYPLLGPLNQLEKIIEEVHPNRIIVALGERRGRLPVRQLLEARMQGIFVEEDVQIYERLTGKLAIESLAPSNLIFSNDFRKSRLNLAIGRTVSLLVSVAALVGLAPLLALIALAIKLDSSGPLFFVQTRVGTHGKVLKLIKFRTMHPTNENTSEWSQDNSHRITRLGKWLRKFRLDELPQFVNILRGEMNLVGPRPHPLSNLQLFVEKIPYCALRSVVRPGVTGWAQVRYGYANNLQEETEKMRYDLYYIKHLSFGFDLRILFDTVKIVLFGRGAGTAHDARVEHVAASSDARRVPAGREDGHVPEAPKQPELAVPMLDARLATSAAVVEKGPK